MEKAIEKIVHRAKQVSLSTKERELLRENVFSFMKEHPISSKASPRPVPSMYSFEFFVRRHSVFATFAILFFLSGSTSVFADKSLPGDVLYPLKTSVNEKVLGWFATSPDSHAEWQLSLADRRLQEMHELSRSEKMTPEVEEALGQKIDSYTKVALGGETVDLLDAPESPVSFATASEISSTEDSAQMAMMAEPVMEAKAAPMAKMMTATFAVPSVDSDELKAKIAEQRQSILKQKNELKNEHLFVKRKAAVVLAEKLTLQADRLKAEGDIEGALRLNQKAQDIISRIEPLSTERKNENLEIEKPKEVESFDDSSRAPSGNVERED